MDPPNREALRELFDYTTFTWSVYGRLVGSMPPEDFTRPVEGSGWPTLHAALFHIASAWDGWLFERFGIEDTPLERADATTWDAVQAYRERLRTLLRRAIDETPDDDLFTPSMPIVRNPAPGVSGGDLLASPGEVITHLLLHERGHHGDISTLMSALGVAPPGIDYLTYVFFKRNQERSRG